MRAINALVRRIGLNQVYGMERDRDKEYDFGYDRMAENTTCE
jgi:hypothetical protein